ncbi:hypothetical protein BDC45DRAFT_521544 [Circinella umbellata]|nr:hypothetical protein BDC45DRAFT_521544 [Circinella umbellata]
MGKSEMAHLATRTMYGSDDWDETNDQWRHLAASLLYHQVYSMAFSSSCNKKSHYEIIGEAEIWLLRSAKQLSQQKQTEKTNTSSPLHYFYGTTLGLETELVCLLKQVFGLFYDMENQNENKKIRKVDVDDVLKLVQNIEEWEHALPKWVQWSTSFNSTETRWLKLKMHIHLIHNIVKILLFRPFSIEPFQQEGGHEKMGDGLEDQVQLNGNDLLQTHTRTTFLDLSLAAADRATLCIRHLHDNTNHKMDNNEDAWVRAGDCLAKDVIRRVKEAFPCDDELFIIIQGIENRFIEKEVIKPSSLPL